MGRKAKRARVLARKARLEMKAAGLVEEAPVVSEPVEQFFLHGNLAPGSS